MPVLGASSDAKSAIELDMAKLIFSGLEGTPKFEIPASGVNIGRNTDCTLHIAEGSVSGHHAFLALAQGKWTLRDNGSSNGTFVNGERISEAEIHDGDEVQFGEVKAKFSDPPVQTAAPVAANIQPAKEEPPQTMEGGDVEFIRDFSRRCDELKENVAKIVIGQKNVVEEVLTAVFARGHALLVGVPGLAKTLLVSTLSKVLDLGFKRVQFTPDLMPGDITGTDVLEEDRASGERRFRFVEGPIFTNMLLADEINRTPPKTQAALLEAMQERHVTVGSKTYPLPDPFFVLATQNPIEQEGTYPLPEAQLDRFMFNIVVTYPGAEDESAIIASATGARQAAPAKSMDGETVLRAQRVARKIPVAPHVIDFARDIVRATRPKQPEAPDFVKELVGWGAGPRAGLALIDAAKARAAMNGRFHATTADVAAVALPVLRHRCITTFAAEAAGVTSDQIVLRLLESVKQKRSGGLGDI